jgi:hypothetical protein
MHAKNVDLSICDTDTFAGVMGDLLAFFYETRASLDFAFQTDNLEKLALIDGKTPLQASVFAFTCCVFITYELVDRFASFAIKYALTTGLRAHLDFLRDEKLSARNFILWDEKSPELLAEYLVDNVSALSECCDEHKHTWVELNAVSVLTKVSAHYKNNSNVVFFCFVAIVSLADDKQIEEMGEIQEIQAVMCEWLARFGDEFADDKVEREVIEIDENHALVSFEMAVYVVNRANDVQVPLLMILRSLFKLSVNHSTRQVRLLIFLFFFELSCIFFIYSIGIRIIANVVGIIGRSFTCINCKAESFNLTKKSEI